MYSHVIPELGIRIFRFVTTIALVASLLFATPFIMSTNGECSSTTSSNCTG